MQAQRCTRFLFTWITKWMSIYWFPSIFPRHSSWVQTLCYTTNMGIFTSEYDLQSTSSLRDHFGCYHTRINLHLFSVTHFHLQSLYCNWVRDHRLDIPVPVSAVSSCLSGSSCGRGWCFLGDPVMRAATNSSSVSHTPPHWPVHNNLGLSLSWWGCPSHISSEVSQKKAKQTIRRVQHTTTINKIKSLEAADIKMQEWIFTKYTISFYVTRKIYFANVSQ